MSSLTDFFSQKNKPLVGAIFRLAIAPKKRNQPA
jgi:hypothetical protein